MNRKQKVVLMAAALVCLTMLLYPPWLRQSSQWGYARRLEGETPTVAVVVTMSAGYGPLWQPPVDGRTKLRAQTVDWAVLAAQLLAVLLPSGALVLVLQPPRR